MSRSERTPADAVHNRIAVLRAERGVSRQELAGAVGIHYQTIGYIERMEYHPSLALALRLAEYFGLPVEAVFSLRPMQPMSNRLYSTGAERDERRT
jgi:DNA-binding XRE family transcriptional regulator